MGKIFAVAVSLFVCASFGFAQEDELFLSLEMKGDSGNFITESVVTKEKIENKNNPGMLDLTASVPGIFVTKAGSQIKSDVSIRGIGDSFRQIGLFVDGRPEKMAVYGCGVSQTLLAGNIDRIEVVKTPDSVLYGGDGFGGLIHVFTAVPQNPFEAEVSASYGSYNTQNYFANLGGKTDKLIYQVSANKISSDGHLSNAGYNASDYYAKFAYKTSEAGELILTGKYFSGDENEPKARTAAGGTIPPSWYEYDRGGVDVRYTHEFDNTNMKIMAFGDFGEHKFFDTWHSKDSIYGAFADFSTELFEGNTLKYGAEYRLSIGKVIAGNSTEKGEWKKSEFALFALDEYEINLKTKVFAGARYNYDEISGSAFVPRAGVSYNITEEFAARAVYSKGFRAPYINELYTVPPHNEELEAQYQNNYEIGINSRYLDVIFDAAAFVINGDNIIQPRPNTPAPPMMKMQNYGSYVFKGFELSAEKEIVDDLKVFAGYSYLDTGDLTQGIAKNKIDASIDYKICKFRFYLGAMVIMDYYAAVDKKAKLDDFNILNAKVHYSVTDNLTLFAATDNFTDQKYEMFIVSFGSARIYEMPGATFTFGAKYKF